jgi:CO/xanthine dehydrogenase FAD-binding subunit
VPPLLALEAEVELSSLAGVRTLPLESFIVGYRKTALRADEILSAVIVPDPASRTRSAFVKLGARKYLVISIVMAAALIEEGTDGAIARALVAVGSASEKACRLGELERDLVGLPLGVVPSSRLRAEHFDQLSPIDDVRATAVYRRDAALRIVGEALDRASAAQSP